MNSNDSTHVATRESWLYLAVIIALQTGQVLGYNLSDRMPDDLVLNALRNACRLEAPAAGTPFILTAAASTPARTFVMRAARGA